MRKFNSTIKLCVRTDKDIGPLTMDEQVKIVKKAIKDRKFYLESINKSESLKSVEHFHSHLTLVESVNFMNQFTISHQN